MRSSFAQGHTAGKYQQLDPNWLAPGPVLSHLWKNSFSLCIYSLPRDKVPCFSLSFRKGSHFYLTLHSDIIFYKSASCSP